MLLACNRSNLKKYAKDLLGNEWSEETEKALNRECLKGFEPMRGHHPSHAQSAHLDRIGKILGTHGTEGFLLDEHGNDISGECSIRGAAFDILYCDAGDTYALTILYYNGRLMIGDWGSIVERCS